MYLALLVPFSLFIAYAACTSWRRSWRRALQTVDTARADLDVGIAAEQHVHGAYDTWYQADDHRDTLHQLPTP